MINLKKLRDLITDKKCIVSDDYGKDDPFIGIYWSDLVNAINQCDSIRWISVEEALPEEEEIVLVTHQYGYQVAAFYKDGSHSYWGVSKGAPIGAPITHWMLIPQIGGEK